MSERLAELRERVARAPVAFDWDEEQWRDAGRRALDFAIAASTNWDARRPSPEDPDAALTLFTEGLPDGPASFDALIDRLTRTALPNSAYNGHPRWLAYITSSALPVSVVGDLAAAAMNQNTALWRAAAAATAIELQTVGWIKEIVGAPAAAEGIFVSGGQFANIVAHAIARDAKTPWDARRYGLRGPGGDAPALRLYASAELHYCHEQAAELLGLGRDALRSVPVDDAYRMRVDALEAMIAEDRARGDLPLTVVATAGTVGTGAVDPLPELVELARREGLWLHVDGAYGAFATLAESCPPALRAMGEADSIACDPHKWLYSAIDAGVVLVREPGLLEGTFSFHASYLDTETRGVDLLERSPENSRPQRALKVWLALQTFGRRGYAAMIEHNIQLAAYLEELVRATPGLRVAAPRELSIVCWRVEPEGVTDAAALDELQTNVIAELERRGVAFISNASLRDGTALRACIVNFRTRVEDIEAVVEASARIGQELATG